MAGEARSAWSLYRRALREVRAWWPHLGAILLLGILWTPLALLLPLPFKIIIDNVLGSEPVPPFLAGLLPDGAETGRDALLLAAIAMTLAIAVVVLIHNTADWLLRETVAERMVRDFRAHLFRHALKVSALSQEGEGAQNAVYRVIHDAPALQWVTIYGLIPIVIALGALAGTLAVTAQISMTVALVALATSVPMVVLIHMHQRRMCDRWHRVKDLDSASNTVVQEALGAWREVVTSGQEAREVERFVARSRRGFRARLAVMGLQSLFGALMSVGVAVGTAAILYLGVREVMAGTLTIGELTLIVTYVGQLYGPVNQIGSHLSNQQSAIASVERSFALLDQVPPVEERAEARPLPQPSAGGFALHGVSFGYPGNRRVLGDSSLVIPAGACIGVVGPTGAGKTTLVSLLVRLFDPTSGRITLDGVDLRDYRLDDLRRQFAVLSQDTFLFSGTVAENIAYACPDAPRERIAEAARLARVHHVIEALPKGYDTAIGDGGITLSGGERQRIGLARTILNPAPILILDEPTSALDLDTEAVIVGTLKHLVRGRTTFLITHRPSALQAADFILRVEGSTLRLTPTGERVRPVIQLDEGMGVGLAG